MMIVNDAVQMVVLAASGGQHGGSRYHRDQCVRLAMQWPSLAAALADLLAAHDYGVPHAFRSARAVLRNEPLEPAERAVQPLQNGAWCFCANGPNADGRGHLRGEAGCNDWCKCGAVPYPHQHDGTMPGSPVIT